MKSPILLCLLAALSFFAEPALSERLVLGSVNDNVRKHVDRTTPLAAYLARELADVGITAVEINVLPTSAAMRDALANGDVHVYFDSPLIAAIVAEGSGGEPMLRRWKRGVGEYHSLIIVRADSDIHTLEDLRGHRIGFQDPDSTSGYLLPIGLILGAGLTTFELERPQDQPPQDAVGYVFTEDDKNTVLWLARRQIDAAATDPRAFAALEKARPGEFRAIAQSITVPRQVVVAGPHLDADLRSELERLLVGLSDEEGGEAILSKFHKTSQFDHFPDGVQDTFAPIHALLESLRAQRVIH